MTGSRDRKNEAKLPFDLRPMPLPADAPGDVRAWLVRIDLAAPLDDAAHAVLHASERARAARFLRHEDAARFAIVRAALRHVLAAETGADPAALILDAGANGRPALAPADAPDFNVSYSGAYGLIAVSHARRVGVDIEAARASFDWRELEASVLAQRDRHEIEAMSEAARGGAFFDCWTAKEAVLKAHGAGIGGGMVAMNGFSVLPRDGVRYAVGREAGAFAAISLGAPAGYAAALAWSV
ncbi:4'-phosphopantetheinyl transferase family protein [Caballeronia ptereochthonis]|uniref:4'-phosphopantetheinyl transferase n=1 Tax=Caballeronia ptereochthonis TaxID=1777144 RepID=A0A158BWT7_9BURK|nr:4'-phosphopantetheinyl transferase superfamily protein [Caballeronia ptereochthonis]SAK74440.1 4'-phosphopantetheinyl transferase [Caballeronia ptereochthonis]